MNAHQVTEEQSFFKRFAKELRVQRWDDHRFYHQSRINQSLHFFSCISFMIMYAMIVINPSVAALLGWLVAMSSRQIGHFFFESRDFDKTNEKSHDYKESVKVGYNLSRKRILMGLVAGVPIVLYFDPTFFGIFQAYTSFEEFLYSLSMVWLVQGIAALIFRTIHLFFIRDVMTGIVWFTKILTDPFHDFKIYWKSPFYLLKGQLIDPMDHCFLEEGDEVEEPLTTSR